MKAIKNILHFVTLGVCSIFSSQAISTLGVTATVLVGSGTEKMFFPATTNIPVNGSVIWTWGGNEHSTTSGTSTNGNGTPNGLWNSGVNVIPYSFTNTFNLAGTYPYYCSVHVSLGMTGSIMVTSSGLPPTVAITNPASGIVLSAPASLTLVANAEDSGGSVTNVQFLQGTTSLGNVAAAPFSISVTNLTAANYTFSAIATADNGLTATNSIFVNVINPSPLTISGPAVLSAGQFQFSYVSDIGLSYAVQVSTNLLSGWTSIATNTATADPTIFTDLNANNSRSFYRVVRLPNP